MATVNLPTYYLDSTAVRSGEVPNADWAGGMNLGGSCAPGVGINTGNYDPKVEDWPNSTFNGEDPIPYDGKSSHIGKEAAPNDRIEYVQGADLNDQAVFAGPVSGNIAIDGDMGAGVLNKTGAIVPDGARAWGVLPVA